MRSHKCKAGSITLAHNNKTMLLLSSHPSNLKFCMNLCELTLYSRLVLQKYAHFLHVDPFSVLNVVYKAPGDKEDKDCRVNFSIPVSDSIY